MAATKVKKPEICTYWWEKVLQYEPTHDEALAELYKLYERNKEWDKLADICQPPGRRRARRQAPRRRAPAPRPALHREGREQREGDRRVAAAARDRREQPRAQDALKKLYVTEGALGRARGVLPLARQDRRVHPRARARGRGRQRAAPAVARDEDRDALPRRAAEGRSRDARVREGALARREQPRRRRGADPALRGRAAIRKALVRVLEIQLRATPTDDQHRARSA